MVDIKQNILSKIDLYTGTILMPKGFEINKEVLQKDILTFGIKIVPVYKSIFENI